MRTVGFWRRRREAAAEMEEELRSHVQHRADDLERSGLDRAEAERRARIEFGGVGILTLAFGVGANAVVFGVLNSLILRPLISRRLKELGIRLALGAPREEVLRAALGRAFQLLAWGSAAGLILGILASRVLAAIVYQATPRDPLVLTGVVVAMPLLGLVATWIPAQRALSIDPMALLREE